MKVFYYTLHFVLCVAVLIGFSWWHLSAFEYMAITGALLIAGSYVIGMLLTRHERE